MVKAMLSNVPSWLWLITGVVFLFWLAVVGLFLRSRDGQVKGRVGEKRVRYLHLTRLNRQEYMSFHDVYLPHPDADELNSRTSTEVDHIVISRFGVFVIETKNIDGIFSGARNDKEWSVITKSGGTHTTDNPFRQNHLHARAVAKFLDIGMSSVRSLVFMVGDCELVTTDEMGPNILARNGLVERIRSFKTVVFQQGTSQVLSSKLADHIASADHEALKQAHRAGYM